MDLPALIMTRVSHDLSGICGALYNTAELMEIETDFSAITPMLKDSSAHLLARLRFFRALFGLDGALIDNALVHAYFKTLSPNFTLNGSVTSKWQLGAILLCCDCLIRGGEILVSEESVIGAGQAKTDPDLAGVLNGTIKCTTPKLAPAAWLCAHAHAKEKNVSVDIKEGEISFALK